jgi:hypothetical protein
VLVDKSWVLVRIRDGVRDRVRVTVRVGVRSFILRQYGVSITTRPQSLLVHMCTCAHEIMFVPEHSLSSREQMLSDNRLINSKWMLFACVHRLMLHTVCVTLHSSVTHYPTVINWLMYFVVSRFSLYSFNCKSFISIS